MKIIIQPTPEAATTIVARLIQKLLLTKPNAVLGLATGSTPVLLYQMLISMKLDWSKVTTFNLDEYIGISSDHPQSYHYFMWENFFRHVNIERKNVHIPDGMAENISEFCKHYEEQIRKAGGIDLQLLGIGANGHIGFNEPTSSLASRTRVKTLAPQTLHDNARFFGIENKVPYRAITMGIGTIMEAQECLLLAFGSSKARALAEAVEGPVTAMNPASALQFHNNVIVCLDKNAASKLNLKDYYQRVFDSVEKAFKTSAPTSIESKYCKDLTKAE